MALASFSYGKVNNLESKTEEMIKDYPLCQGNYDKMGRAVIIKLQDYTEEIGKEFLELLRKPPVTDDLGQKYTFALEARDVEEEGYTTYLYLFLVEMPKYVG